MAIDRTNYELWFTDWADNNLNPEQISELAAFLRENPDLAEEFRNPGHISLEPPATGFTHKKSLLRSSEDMFDYLCAAYFENDLTDIQKSELEEMVRNDPEKQRSLSLMMKTRLAPPVGTYQNKNLLLRRPAARKNIWLPVLELGVAAVIAVLLMLSFFKPSGITGTTENRAALARIDSSNDATQSLPIQQVPPVITANNTKPSGKVRDRSLGNVKAVTPEATPDINTDKVSPVDKITVKPYLFVAEAMTDNELASFNPGSIPAEADDDRSRIGKFLAKTFREKILRDENAADTPLKGYELAEAGVTGINKLFGWDMGFVTNNDENGKPSSVNFTSRLVKFTAPVKKSEQAE